MEAIGEKILGKKAARDVVMEQDGMSQNLQKTARLEGGERKRAPEAAQKNGM